MALTNYSGAVAVVTGGASGIGLATARALRAKGAHIVLADINGQGLQNALRQLSEERPAATTQAIASTADVTNASQVQETMRRALTITGRIDLVVACAGISRAVPIDQMQADEMQRMMDINFMGIFQCVQAALPAMRRQQPLLSGYCATKWAVRGFATALRAELFATGIGITTVYPAYVDTPMVHQEDNSEFGDLIHMKILLTADQVADAILQAVSQDQRDLTLAPNKDIAYLLEVMKDNPDKVEDLAGESFHRRMQRRS
jgi:NAD(P)-dependent dehydrogenase (short-subunit alcohol dehydrogenase family)